MAKKLRISVVLSENSATRNLDVASEVLFRLLKEAGLLSLEGEKFNTFQRKGGE